MNQRVFDQLDKVLALADSNHEGEALGALRMLRRILEREGTSFSHLAQAVTRPSFSLSRVFFSGTQVELEARIEQLQDDLAAHVEQNASLTAQIDFWRRRAFEVEQQLNLQQAEAARWKDMARETTERLWDLAQMAQAEKEMTPFEDDKDGESLPLREAG